MLKILIRRELLNNLMTFRFAAVMLITLLLVVANTAVLIQDYEQRVESYNDAVKTHYEGLRKAETYSTMYLFVDRAPNPLSIFNVGLDKRLGTLSVFGTGSCLRCGIPKCTERITHLLHSSLPLILSLSLKLS